MASDHGAEQMSTSAARAREVDRLRQVAAKAEQARLAADFWRKKDPARSALASASFHRAMDEVYPASWWETVAALQRGEVSAVEPAIVFLEADPRFFRSGYVKEALCRFLGRAPLTAQQRNRPVSGGNRRRATTGARAPRIRPDAYPNRSSRSRRARPKEVNTSSPTRPSTKPTTGHPTAIR